MVELTITDLSNNEEASVFPFKLSQEQRMSEQYYIKLQSTMMDNGWNLYEGDDVSEFTKNEYFIHPTYKGQRANIFTHRTFTGKIIKLPIINYLNDPKGLGCNIELFAGGTRMKVVNNKWTHCKDTRRARRNRKNRGRSNKQKKNKQIFELMKANDEKKKESKYGLRF